MTAKTPVITIDGPSGAGKGTLSKSIAHSLNWRLLDSGAIYRALALSAFRHKVDITSEKALASLAAHLDVCLISQNAKLLIILAGEDISNKIRTSMIEKAASEAAKLPQVRKALLRRLRAFRQNPGLVADGRDMGTVVFPDALVKIFLDANIEARVQRRKLQLQESGLYVTFEWLLTEIQERDKRDRNRAAAPLIPAAGAFVLNSTSLSIEEVIQKALEYIKKVISLP